MHPLIDAIVDFLVWALLVPAVTFATWGGSFRLWRTADSSMGASGTTGAPGTASEGIMLCMGANALSRECFPALYRIGGLELGGVILSCFVWYVRVQDSVRVSRGCPSVPSYRFDRS